MFISQNILLKLHCSPSIWYCALQIQHHLFCVIEDGNDQPFSVQSGYLCFIQDVTSAWWSSLLFIFVDYLYVHPNPQINKSKDWSYFLIKNSNCQYSIGSCNFMSSDAVKNLFNHPQVMLDNVYVNFTCAYFDTLIHFTSCFIFCQFKTKSTYNFQWFKAQPFTLVFVQS